MYNAGYAAQPGIVQLRSGETFTRYFDRDHFGGPEQRRFWHNQKGGPFRDWTFVNMGTPEHNGSQIELARQRQLLQRRIHLSPEPCRGFV